MNMLQDYKKKIILFFLIFIGIICIIPIFFCLPIPISKSTLMIVSNNVLIKPSVVNISNYFLKNNEKMYSFESIDKKTVKCYISGSYVNNNEYYFKLSIKNEIVLDEGMYWVNFNYGNFSIMEYYYYFS